MMAFCREPPGAIQIWSSCLLLLTGTMKNEAACASASSSAATERATSSHAVVADGMTAPSDGAGTAAPPSARSLLSRRTHIQPGDTILLELPTKLVKVVKLSLDSRNIVQLGKYGTFDADAELVGKPYGVTYEIVPASGSTSRDGESSGETAEGAAGAGAEAGDTAEVDGANAADGAADGKMSGASKRKQKREAAKEKTRSAKGKGKGVAVTNSTSKQLDSLRPLEGLSLDDIEVTEATNEKILAQGAKVRRPIGTRLAWLSHECLTRRPTDWLAPGAPIDNMRADSGPGKDPRTQGARRLGCRDYRDADSSA